MTAHYQETNTLYQLKHLAIIKATGDDATQFLQGQLTCNVKELSDSIANIAAFCNPKGRVISTLLIIKTQTGYLLVLPHSLLDKVLKKLQMYVLRSKVQLTDQSKILTLAGLTCPNPITGLDLPPHDFQCKRVVSDWLCVKLPSSASRFLCVADANLDAHQSFAGFATGHCDDWRYQDISAGFPWFGIDQSEKHIPQMLNIDQLGGVSFTKGCYTGQEIVARTHYLGKSKRQLRLGECKCDKQLDSNVAVKDAETQEKIGEILASQSFADTTRLLIVLQSVDCEAKNLILDDPEQTPVSLIPFQ